MKFLVIGGDAAGMSAASRAKRNNSNLDITVLEKTMDVSYSACGMPYNIADSNREIEDLVVRRASVFREKQGINVLTGHFVESINPLSKTVTGISLQEKKFQFSYDKLLIATGGSPIIPDLPGFDLPGVLALKSLDDGRKIKAYIKVNTVKKAVIVGMGYIGLEMCEALRARSIEVDMVKPGPVFLPWMEEELSGVVRKEVETNKVKLHPGHKLQKIEAEGRQLKVICSDLILEADMVLVAIGIKPNSELASGAGLDLGISNAVAVDRNLKTSDQNIYAAGDCADAYHVVSGKKTWIPLALRANRAGWAVADNICGKAVELPGIAGTAVFKVFDLEVASTGLTMKEALNFGFEPAKVIIKTRSRAHAHPGASVIHVLMIGDKKSGRLLGAQMVGKEGVAHRINAIAVALHGRMNVDEYCQTDLAYAPPFGPVWDPTLTAANQLLKKIKAGAFSEKP
ncbi:MAG: FAD-dependent oxidoreductase [Thermodesulfobacteriota bacterium]|nr:FAD-dependent oxidoreductase [Thermodesulfobacteriota bacterium]